MVGRVSIINISEIKLEVRERGLNIMSKSAADPHFFFHLCRRAPFTDPAAVAEPRLVKKIKICFTKKGKKGRIRIVTNEKSLHTHSLSLPLEGAV